MANEIIDWVDISNEPHLAWQDALEVIGAGIKQVVKPQITGARVYPTWVYEIDIQSMLGKVTAAMKATSGTSAGLAHCWTIGVNTAVFVKGADGLPEFNGCNQWNWTLTLDVWGFHHNDGKAETQRKAKDEARKVAAFLWRNSIKMVESTPFLVAVKPLEFSNLQPSPFSDGSSVIVSSGVMQIEIAEEITI